jgi:ATP-dependent exoDNAse (exonuclease V) alpha subunit
MAQTNTLNLNEAQTKAYHNLRKFILSEKNYNFLLLGPAGSGKTTVIVNTFNDSKYRIAFCAFTNKATQVLKKISDKFNINFEADFMTVHKLLALEIKYLDKETEIAFNFEKNKVDHLKEYDVIIFDECSTISKELYKYIVESWQYIKFAHDIKLKFIFLGDYWQLPPVGEEKAIIFDEAIKNKWLVSKLDAVMRASNDTMAEINKNMLSYINLFKNNDDSLSYFVKKYPYNLLDTKYKKYLSLDNLLNDYINTWKNVNNDTVILTYTRSNCDKTNFSIQDRIDIKEGRSIPENRIDIKFYKGDRCCIDKPVEIYSIKECILGKTTIDNKLEENDTYIYSSILDDNTTNNNDLQKNIRTVSLDTSTNEILYNGEIFDIVDVEDVKISTPLNKFKYMPNYFNGQLLKLCKINDYSVFYEVLHIPESVISDAKKSIRKNERKMFYITLMSEFTKKYPKLNYGYCITIYKSQGSEYNTVYVNLNSIKWSIVGSSCTGTMSKKMLLFKTTYTALSRASNNLYCCWSV